MKENIIFCYSGTGNCLDMAKNIAASLGDTDIVMIRRYPVLTDVREAKRVGFIFPCYGGGMPGHMERYIRDINVSPDAYTFGIVQCAAYKGEGLARLNEVITLDYWASVTHQDSCIWLFPHDFMLPKMDAEAAQARSEEFAAKFAEDIKAEVKTTGKLSNATLTSLEHSKWPSIARMAGQKLKANDNCTLCGQCAELCPTDNIRYVGKAVVFSDKCISCCGCLQYCPQSAISMGKVTDKREHYHNPNVSAEELTQEIISY